MVMSRKKEKVFVRPYWDCFLYSEGERENSFLNILEKANWSSKPKESAIIEIGKSVVFKRDWAFSVSYTHLDVYKRQVQFVF